MAKKATAPATIEEKMEAALVPSEKQPYAVPENWCWTQLKSLCVLNNGRAFKPTDWADHGLPIIRIQNLNNPDNPFNYYDGQVDESVRLYGGELLFAWSGTPGTSFGAHIWYGKDAVLNQHIFRVDFNESCLLKQFFMYAINQQLNNLITAAHGGAGLQHVTKGVFESTPIPLPPLAEQRRIVNRIETMFSKLDEAKEKAQAVIDGYEDRKAAILYRSFAGELTKEWENKHISNDFSPWQETRFEDIIYSIEAGKNWNAEGRPPEGDEFGVVKVSSVTWGEFDELESKTCMIPEQWNPEKQIRQGDFLFSRANTLQLVGNCVIVKSVSRRLMLSDKILRFHFTDSILPTYVLYFTRSQQYRRQIEELASGNQDGMRNVSQQNLRKVQIPTPSKAEQREIVHILDDLLSKEAAVKEAAETTLATIDTMKQSILSRAFRGELGTNDPNDEPAEELMKRILLDQL